MWARLHPVYLRMFGDGARSATPVRDTVGAAGDGLLDLSMQEQHP
jgi:hypothetical protein